LKEKKKPPIASREEIQAFFEEEQRLEDERKRQNLAKVSQEVKKAFSSADIERLIQSSNREFMDWFYSTVSPDIHSVEVPPAGGPASKRNSSSRKRKVKRKMPRPSEFWKLE